MSDVAPRPQTTLAGTYRLERELGRGGMATVYLAEDRKHRRPVAVKILHPHLAEHLGAERFLREIEIAARFNHPHILTLIDSGKSGGHLYYVMPYVEGETLRERLRRGGRLPLDEALTITRQVASALGYAHGRGVVHRDIKPENIMLHEGGAIVTDFGIARAVGESGAGGQRGGGAEKLTATGISVGTPTYMSPEQAAGETELDGRSDLYSLGCVLFEMLAGEPPFTGIGPHAVMIQRFSAAAPSLTSRGVAVPPQIERALARVLEREPDARYATAAQFSNALQLAGSSAASSTATIQTAAQSPGAGKSIAVLPFTDLSPGRDQEYFADGITEEIINALSKIRSLRVASRSSAFAFKGKSVDIRRIGEQLNVTSILEGSVRKAGNRLRVTAQLVNASDGYHLWSERYDRDMEDIFAVQDDIATRVAETLRVVLSDEERRAMEVTPAADIRAYDYYLRGRELTFRHQPKAYQHALQMFQRAIEIDPAYARGYAGLADCYAWLYHYLESTETNLRKAEEASRKALELDPDSAEAHASRAHVLGLGKHFEEARAEFETAIRLAPTLFEPHYLFARACWAQGLMEEAARHFEDAARVRPEDYQAPSLLSNVYDALGDTEKADDARRRALAAARRHLELYPGEVRALYLGAGALLRVGHQEEAQQWAEQALRAGSDDPAMYYNLACFYSASRNTDAALDCLEKAVALGFAHRDWLLNDADLRPLRGHPRLQTILDRLPR
ncbi:MAG TPA: protein kinase [Gemmatimonadales bacterium]|nr:protein kinase [Gemmatimonadales bacterium]